MSFAVVVSRRFFSTLSRRGCHQYLVVARDFADPEALQRRMAVRPAHFRAAKVAKDAGVLVTGGALLDKEDGAMRGSMLIVNAPNREAVDEFVKRDMYHQGKVWETYQVYPLRLADIDGYVRDLERQEQQQNSASKK